MCDLERPATAFGLQRHEIKVLASAPGLVLTRAETTAALELLLICRCPFVDAPPIQVDVRAAQPEELAGARPTLELGPETAVSTAAPPALTSHRQPL